MNNTPVALIPIHSRFADEIYDGTKCFEYRRIMPKRPIDILVFYETSPVCAITGYALVKGALEDTPPAVWRLTREGSGISKADYEKYFSGKKRAVAICIDDSVAFVSRIGLKEVNVSTPPQSIQYLSDEASKYIIERIAVEEKTMVKGAPR